MYMRLWALVLLGCACGGGGNVVGSERVKLAAMTVAGEAGVTVSELAVEVLDVRADDGKVHAVLSLEFTAAGERLKMFSPSYRYACAVGDVIVSEGFVGWGNMPEGGVNRPDFSLHSLGSYLKITGSAEPSVCEFTLQLAQRGPSVPYPAKKPTRPLGALCYRSDGGKRTLADGACAAGSLGHKPDPAATITAKLLEARPTTTQPGDRASVLFTSLLTVHRALAPKTSVTFQTTCGGKAGTETLGMAHFEDVAPGESIVHMGPSTDPDKHGDPKQCEIAVVMKVDAAQTELGRSCWRDGAIQAGGCG
jgi:hypothetical protein